MNNPITHVRDLPSWLLLYHNTAFLNQSLIFVLEVPQSLDNPVNTSICAASRYTEHHRISIQASQLLSMYTVPDSCSIERETYDTFSDSYMQNLHTSPLLCISSATRTCSTRFLHCSIDWDSKHTKALAKGRHLDSCIAKRWHILKIVGRKRIKQHATHTHKL